MREAYLEMVTTSNNNKYYHMLQTSDDMFEVYYGRIGASKQTARYSISQWDKKYSEKIRKGYRDTTDLQVKTVQSNEPEEYKPIPNQEIAALIESLRRAANDTIKANYKIEANAVSAEMIRTAQNHIYSLLRITDKDMFNQTLLDLFTALPRKMSRVPDYLLNENTAEMRQKIITREQQLLDVMSSQVVDPAGNKTAAGIEPKNNMTILEAFHLKLEPATAEDVALIRKELGDCGQYFQRAWRVTNEDTEAAFQAHVKANKITKRKRKLFWHGSRTENWWGILKTGLKLRPTNVVITGKMFGMGTYFAPKARKSLGYTSLRGSYWTGGSSECGFLALFDTAYGKPWVPDRYFSEFGTLDYEKLQKLCPGADCVHAKAGLKYDGRSLLNDEIIFYKEQQMTIRYLVEVKK